jgi:hypothetical protein
MKNYTPEESEHRRQLSRERNRRFLAKRDPEVLARRAIAEKRYKDKLANDSSYADRAEIRKIKAVERTKLWQAANPEKVKEHARKSRQKNPSAQVAKTQRRNAAKLQAIPTWADNDKIKRYYENAQYLSQITGCQHHVDHIIPLRGKTVCGLHVENNLRVIPHYLNTRKGNTLEGN